MVCAESEIHYLTPSEVAERCRVSVQSVYHWINHGIRKNGVVVQLEANTFGDLYRITEEALRAFSRRCDRRVWQAAAQEQETERKQARRDQKRLRQRLNTQKAS